MEYCKDSTKGTIKMNVKNLFTKQGFLSYVRKARRLYGLNRFRNRRALRRNKVCYGRNLIINGKLLLVTSPAIAPGDISLGDYVVFNSDINKTNPLGFTAPCILRVDKGGTVKIGNHVGMSNCTIVSYKDSICIGDYTTIGAGVRIINTDFHPIDAVARRYQEDDLAKTAPIRIEENVFIGMGAMILKGVTIGRDSIIGAGSVVAKNIPAGEIWAGNPAKFIKKVGE